MKAYRIAILYRYLLENTCKGHTVNADNIVEHYENEGDPYEIKAVYRDLHDLEKIDGITLHYDGRTKGWWMEREGLTPNELRLIVDSIQASKFITQERARAITGKVLKLTDRHTRASLNRQSYVAGRVRSMNDSIFYHLDDLHTAIANDWQITFKYFYFTPKKQKAFYKKGELYTASPYALLWSDNNYYLLAFEGGKMKHFRVDKMDGISIVAQKREGKKEFKELNLSERSLRMFSMFSGKVQNVKIRFSNHLANVVIDRFGRDIVMIPEDEKHFTIHTDIEVSPQFFGWLCGLGKGVRILSPADVVEEMGNYVKGIAEMY